MRRLRVQVIFEGQILPVKAVLLITDFPDGFPDSGLDFFLRSGCPVAVRINHALAADFASQNHPVGRGQGFASNPGFRILGKEQIYNGVRNLIRNFVWMAFRDRFGGENKF